MRINVEESVASTLVSLLRTGDREIQHLCIQTCCNLLAHPSKLKTAFVREGLLDALASSLSVPEDAVQAAGLCAFAVRPLPFFLTFPLFLNPPNNHSFNSRTSVPRGDRTCCLRPSEATASLQA